jgi:ferric enterobactin receptor
VDEVRAGKNIINLMKIVFTALCALIMVSIVQAQTASLKGNVSDKITNQLMELATVGVYRSADSVQVQGVVTNKEGHFEVKIKEGTYYVRIDFIGYSPAFISALKLSAHQHQDLGTIFLTAPQQLMGEVRVSAQKASLYSRIDKQVYKADQFQAAKGGMAIDVLKNMPSVTVNGEGQISMRGSAGFQVLLNGKPILTDAQTILSQLPANTIENIELITAPSARFDPDGKGGIINITTKKGVGQGLTFSANVQGGLPTLHNYDNKDNPMRYGADATINFQKGKWDLVASGNFLRNNLAGYREGDVFTLRDGIRTSFPSAGERSFDRYSYAGRATAIFTPDKRNSFTLGLYQGKKFQARTADLLYHNSKVDVNTGDTLSQYPYFNHNLQTKQGQFSLANLDYTHNFPNKSFLTTSVLYEFANLYGNTQNHNLGYPTFQDTVQYTYNPNTNPLYGLRTNIDYALPLGPGKLESGYQFRSDKQKGSFSYYTKDRTTGEFVLDPQFSSMLESRNIIHSIYSQYSGQVKKLNFNGGLRYEYAHRELHFNNGSDSVLNLSNLFPSANILYSLPYNLKLKAGYSRRVQRARNNELNPYPEREHSETLEQGDPNLLPEYINLVELGLIKNIRQGSFFTTFYHQQITNPIQRVNKVFNDTILNRMFTNAGQASLWGLEFGGSVKPAKWWQLYAGGNVYKYAIDGHIFNNTIKLSNANWVYSLNANTSFELSTTWMFQLNVNYLSERPTAQGKDSRFLSPNTSLKKTFWNGRMSAMLQWQNMDMGLLSSNEQRISTWGHNFYTKTNYIYEVDVIMLHISFNLNQLTKKIKLPTSEFGEREF